MTWVQNARRRTVAVLIAAGLVSGGVLVPNVAAANASATEPPEWFEDLEPSTPADDPVAPPIEEAESAPLLESTPVDAAEFSWPDAGVSVVRLDGDEWQEAADGALALRAASDEADGADLRVEVLDPSVPQQAGVPGLVFEVSGAAGSGTLADQARTGAAAADDTAEPDEPGELGVQLSVDYSSFADAYGGGYSDRLRVVALPSCALATPRPEDCKVEGVPVPTQNDAETSVLTGEVADLTALVSAPSGNAIVAPGELPESTPSAPSTPPGGSAGPIGAAAAAVGDELVPADPQSTVVFALMSGPSGSTGSWTATPLSTSAKWQVAPGSGEFSWSYDVPVPAPPIGVQPDVNLSYSSGAVDGLVSTANTQSPQTGTGWSDFASAFVERRYTPCEVSGDLCWRNQNATISLNGHASELIALDSVGTNWRLKSDPGWRVSRLAQSFNNGDNNNEYWKVTDPNGTQYFFGWGRNPESGVATDSVWTVPVYADDAADPCSELSGDWCMQGWRWNLDYVIDPNGITTSYDYVTETNRYRALNGLHDHQQLYVRGGRLESIEYGRPQGSGASFAAAGRVEFDAQFRCNTLDATCPTPTQSNAGQFHEVPNDFICVSDCLLTTPTFFSGKRYTAVRTMVRVNNDWKAIDQVNLSHGLWENSEGDWEMFLAGIQRVGGSEGGLLALPAISFLPQELPNRVDVDLVHDKKAMGHVRVAAISDEYGGETWITYGRPPGDTCAATKTGPWDTNTQACFQRKFRGAQAIFHKYVTLTVDERDATTGSPNMVTQYVYEGEPGWHFDDDEFVPVADQGWTDWRGYGSVTIKRGPPAAEADSQSRIQVFRGMNNDRLANGTRRIVPIEPFDGAGFDAQAAVFDEPWMSGAVLQDASYGEGGVILQGTLHEYEARNTAIPGSDTLDWATWVGEKATTNSTAKAGGWDKVRASTTYNFYNQPEAVYDEGVVGTAGDEQCTRTTYAIDDPAFKVAYPATTVTLVGDCSSTNEMARSETYYDGHALDAAPTNGRVTKQRTKVDATRWITTAEMTYDAYGRVLTVKDANGLTTKTLHELTPNGGFPRSSVTTTHLGATQTSSSTTNWVVGRGVPLDTTDANGKLTSYSYDDLGRARRVRLPTEQPYTTGKPPSWDFNYQIDPAKLVPPIVRSTSVSSTDLTKTEDAWQVYDSFLRPRQTQTLSPESGKVIAASTFYDDLGQVETQTSAQAISGTAGLDLLVPASPGWANKTQTLYDRLGRVSSESWFQGSTQKWATGYTYTHDTIKVTAPDGAQTVTHLDGLGRTVQIQEKDGANWRATNYGYDWANRQETVTDPAGNTIVNKFNMAGWRTEMDDPDSGLWKYEYNDAGLTTKVTDAKNAATFTEYDAYGRPTRTHTGNPNAPLATWVYDAPGEFGLLDKSTRFTSQGNWETDITGYDGRGRVLGKKWTVPLSAAGFAPDYTINYGYDPADRVVSTAYPAIAGLPAETIKTDYDTLGLPDKLTNTSGYEYVWASDYDNRARPTAFGFGPHSSGPWLGRSWSYDANQRLGGMQTVLNGSSTATIDHQFVYNEAGTLKERTTKLGASEWRECYKHDEMRRMTEAYTTVKTAGTTDCTSGAKGTGGQPYQQVFTFSPDGNMLTRSDGTTTKTYTYPTGTGVDRPHAPTSVASDGYQWDANGNLTQRTVGGQAETLTWDVERRLSSISGPAGANSFVYDANGARLLRTTPQGRTLYIDGHEITANTSGSTVTATRSYSFGGSLVATRVAGGVKFLVADQQGTVEASFPAGGAIDISRTYAPYGLRRSGGEFDTDQGWIGQVEDDAAKLSYLNARYYDANLGRFISPDPVFDKGRPQTINPYAYGLNNPTSNSDPSGECVPVGDRRDQGCVDARWPNRTNDREIARGIKSSTRPQASLDALTAEVTQKREAYENSPLRRMCSANCDPGFWRALAAAGSGDALVLHGLAYMNPDPGFWAFMAAVSQACGRNCTTTEVAHKARRTGQEVILNIKAREARIMAMDGVYNRVGMSQDDIDRMVAQRMTRGCSGLSLCHLRSATEGIDAALHTGWLDDHRWQIAGVAVSGICIVGSGTIGTAACLSAGATLFAFKTSSTIESGGSAGDHAWNVVSTMIMMAGASGWSAAELTGWGAVGARAMGESFSIVCSFNETCANPGQP